MPGHCSRPLELQAESSLEWIEAEAADGAPKPKSFTMRAYTGGPMETAQFSRPIVVDLAGVTAAEGTIPILRGHSFDRLVGHGTVEITASGVKVDGVISAANDHAREVQETAANGFPWQASIGASVRELEVLGEKDSALVNGRRIKGPAFVARKTVLNEISFVPLGADRRTSVKVAATARTEENDMKYNEWLTAKGFDPDTLTADQSTALKAAFDAENKPAAPANPTPIVASNDGADGEPDYVAASRKARAAEAQRVASIEATAAKYKGVQIEADGQKVDLAAHAIGEGWTTDRYELEAMRAARPSAPAVHVHNRNVTGPVLEAAVCMAGSLQTLEKSFDDKTLDAAARQFRHGITVQELLAEAAMANGYIGGGPGVFRRDHAGVLRAAFSTASLSGILSNTANKFLLEGFMHVEQAWRTISAKRAVGDFKTVTSYRMTGDFAYEQIGPTGKIKHDTIDEESYTNQAKTYARMFAITREMQINDDLGALSDIPRRIGRGAGLKLNDVFWTAFVDNTDFFKTANANYFEGGGTTLQSSQLQVAEQKFLDQTDPDGNPVNAMAKYLLIPTALAVTAAELFQSTLVVSGNTTKTPNTNVWAGKYEPVVSTYLGNANYGNSSTAWYLLADPMDVPVIEVAFLNGVETPTVESADADFNTLGIQMRGYHDFGVTKQDYRGGVKSKGAA